MNICLTSYCNQACPYCFSSHILHNLCPVQEISLPDLTVAADYYAKMHGTDHINLYGGEPTLHSKLTDILDRLFDRGFSLVRLFTNGLISDAVLPVLERYGDRLSFCWNVNPPDHYSPRGRRQLHTSLTRLTTPTSSLGFNIYHTSYDPGFVFPILSEIPKLSIVRIGIAHPIPFHAANSNRAVTLSEYSQIGRIIYDFVMRVIRQFPSIRHIHIDCGYTPCLFTDEQRHALERFEMFGANRCSGMSSLTVVLPDLSLSPCFCHGELPTPIFLSDFKTLRAAYAFMHSTAKIFFLRDSRLEPPFCADCDLRSECDGGCCGEKVIRARSYLESNENPHIHEMSQEIYYGLALAYARLHDYKTCLEMLHRANEKNYESESLLKLRLHVEDIMNIMPKRSQEQ